MPKVTFEKKDIEIMKKYGISSDEQRWILSEMNIDTADDFNVLIETVLGKKGTRPMSFTKTNFADFVDWTY